MGYKWKKKRCSRSHDYKIFNFGLDSIPKEKYIGGGLGEDSYDMSEYWLKIPLKTSQDVIHVVIKLIDRFRKKKHDAITIDKAQ